MHSSRTHTFGARGDSIPFNDYFFRFWENTFFPYIEEHKIKHIVHLGDFVDRRKFINYQILNTVRTSFLDKIPAGCHMDVIVGNHDVPFRNTNEVNAIQELFGDRENVTVYSRPFTITFDGLPIAIIPWINNSNYQETLDFIKSTPALIAMGHLEIAGFQMDRGNVSLTGMPREAFSKFNTVYTGHFHHRSSDGHIYYLGNTYAITWADYGDTRGFHVFDTETLELEFIENPYQMFHKIVYDDTVETLETIADADFSKYHNTIVKVIMKTKNDLFLFDNFMDKLYAVLPLDVSIVENFTDAEQSEVDIVDQADSTTVILDKVVDTLDISIDKDKMKNILRNVYNQALDLENQ